MILVTGANGMTGRALVDRLRAEGETVFGVGQQLSDTVDNIVDLRSASDIVDAIHQLTPRIIIHLAAISAPIHDQPSELYDINVIGTQRLLAALAQAPTMPERVILASSATIYAVPSDAPLAEDTPHDPLNHYALSKMMMEQLAAFYGKLLPITVVRPFNYTGPYQTTRFLIPKLVSAFARRVETLNIGNLDIYRDFSDLADVVEAYTRLIKADQLPSYVNICSGSRSYMKDVVEQLRNLSGHDPRLVVDPNFVRPNEPGVILGDRSLLDSTIGSWERIPFDETVTNMYSVAHAALEKVR